MMRPVSPPIGLLAELTHRCPLGCPYCSNLLELESKHTEMDLESWKRIFREAADLGVLHVHLSGGEPAARVDLEEIVAYCMQVGLYANLITSGIGLTRNRLNSLVEKGLDHIQLSIQDVHASSADRIADFPSAYARKKDVAAWAAQEGIPLTLNAVIHRANIDRAGDMVDLAVDWRARRIEIAHVQYYGWALRNRAHLMPTQEQSRRAYEEVEARLARYAGQIVVDHVAPDYHADYPKACMNGWGRTIINVSPRGVVSPCHAAHTIPDLPLWSLSDHSLREIWEDSPAFNAFRGFDWMDEPCRSCARRELDFGGCRCQALALVGSAKATDPVCSLSPHHARVAALAETESSGSLEPHYIYRR